MGRNDKTKSIKSQEISIACKSVSYTTFSPLSLLSDKKLPSTRPKTQATRRKCLRRLSSKLRSSGHIFRPSSRCTLKGPPAELVVPMSRSIIKEITDLEWMFDNEIGKCFDAWDTIEKVKQKNISNQEDSTSSRPSWGQAPTSCPYRSVWKSMDHLHWAWMSHIDLQIPSSWSVFDNLDSMQDGNFWLASTDSEALEGMSSGSSGSPRARESPRASSRPAHFKPTVTCRGESLTSPRDRGQWNTFATMVPHEFNWKYQTYERALQRDKVHHTGYVDLNQYARNHDIWPQNSFPSVLSHWEAGLEREHLKPVNELSWQLIGRWLATVVATDMFPAQCEQPAKWHHSLKTDETFANVDYICRATPQSIGWREEMCPILFAAQYDPHPDSFRCGQHSAARKLASVFQPTMTILILYYLDTRVNTDDPMPPWMVLFGIQYNESGVIIRSHSPCFQPSIPSGFDTKRSGWRATSSVVNETHEWDMLKLGQHRGPLLNTLNRIQGHSSYVLGHLKAWDGYERACELLML